VDVTPHCSVLVCEWLLTCMFYESGSDQRRLSLAALFVKRECQNISLYEPEQSLSLSQDEGEQR